MVIIPLLFHNLSWSSAHQSLLAFHMCLWLAIIRRNTSPPTMQDVVLGKKYMYSHTGIVIVGSAPTTTLTLRLRQRPQQRRRFCICYMVVPFSQPLVVTCSRSACKRISTKPRARGSRACIGLASRREDRNLRHGVARHAVYEEGEYQRNLGHLGTLFAKQNTCCSRAWSYSRSINSLRSRP